MFFIAVSFIIIRNMINIWFDNWSTHCIKFVQINILIFYTKVNLMGQKYFWYWIHLLSDIFTPVLSICLGNVYFLLSNRVTFTPLWLLGYFSFTSIVKSTKDLDSSKSKDIKLKHYFAKVKAAHMNNTWVKVLKHLLLNLLEYQKYK